MTKSTSGSFLVLKIIGILFSIAALILACLVIWLIISRDEQAQSADWSALLLSSSVLAIATASIAGLIWWIVTHPKRFWHLEQ